MAPTPRRKFSVQFNAGTLQLVIQNDRPITPVTTELQSHRDTVGRWVKLHRVENPKSSSTAKPTDRRRLAELEAQVDQLRMENEFLKKAAVFFAQEQR